MTVGISSLPSVTSLTGAEELPLIQVGVTKKATITDITNLTLTGQQGPTDSILVGGGIGLPPVWTEAVGTGSPVRQDNTLLNSPTMVTPTLGDASATSLTLTTALAIDQGGTGQTTKTNAFDALAPTTTLGDIIYHNGTDNVRLPKGIAQQVLQVSADELSLEWVNPAGGGDALTSQPLSQFAATTSLQLKGVISDETGSGALVFADTPTLVTPVLGSATATTINKLTLTQPANGSTLTLIDGTTVTGPSATTTLPGLSLANTFTTGQLFQPLTDVAGVTVRGGPANTANVLQIQASAGTELFTINGAGHVIVEGVTSTGATGTKKFVFSDTPTIDSPTLTAPALGTPASGILTNCTGTASGLTAGTVTTNANLTGHVTSVGNAAVLGSFTYAQLNTAISDENVAGLGAANSFTTAQLIQPATDVAPLTLRGAPTPTANLLQLQASNNSPLFTVGPAGHVLVEGVTSTGATGTGKFVFDTSPTLVTPVLGTPSSGTLTNCTGLPAAGVTGTALVASAIGTTVQAYDADLTTWAGVTPGTGVTTALAVNTGTAGSFVVNGGALGTPSSGTLTNCTGTATGLVAGRAIIYPPLYAFQQFQGL